VTVSTTVASSVHTWYTHRPVRTVCGDSTTVADSNWMRSCGRVRGLSLGTGLTRSSLRLVSSECRGTS